MRAGQLRERITFQTATPADSDFGDGEATWADWDHRGRLVVARDGRLWVWNAAAGLSMIEDFNGQVPDPQPAPP